MFNLKAVWLTARAPQDNLLQSSGGDKVIAHGRSEARHIQNGELHVA